MGQKINPTGFRVGVIKDWESRWYAGKKDFGNTLISDYELRNYLLSTLAPAGVPKVEIEEIPRESASTFTALSPVWLSVRAVLRSRSSRMYAKQNSVKTKTFSSIS